MRHYWQLYRTLAGAYVRSRLQYRWSFWLGIFVTLITDLVPLMLIGIVFTRFGSLTDVGGGEDTSGATACAEGCGAVTRGAAGAVGSETGCSSRGTTRSAEACAPIRSWNGLL